MNVVNYRVSLDMFDTLSQTTIKAKKGDSACKIHITLTKNGKIFNIGEGCYATFNAKKSDGNFIYDNCTIEGDTIVYDFSSSIDENGACQVSAIEGNVDCETTLYNSKGEQLTSPRFTLFIDGVIYNGEEISSSPETDVLKGLVIEATKLVEEVGTKLENGDFDGKSAYAYAVDGGYEGTEEDFAKKLASDEITPDWVATQKVSGGEEVYISQQTLTSGMWSKLQMNFQVGLTYDVYFNGEIYPCVAYNEDGGVYLGNITLMDSTSTNIHNNEPFCIYWAGAGATAGFFYKDSAVSYPITLKVTDHASYEYNKMPKEYLPDEAALKSDIPEANDYVLTDADKNEIAQMAAALVPGGGAESVNADYEQNEATAPDYIKNRPFYSQKTQIFEDKDKVYTINGSTVTFNLEVGKNYVVSVNETEYEAICEQSTYNDSEAKKLACGDYAIYIANGLLYLTYPDGEDNATIALIIELDDIKKIDKKYLPEGIGGGGTSIDVTAEVGQTIIVKEVDANGKPTKWESADYQPRTHYMETILPETTGEADPDMGAVILPLFTLVADETYTVKYNGVEYTCKCFGMDGTFVLGNLEAAGVPGGNGEPFVIAIESYEGETFAYVFDVTGATSLTISISKYVPIPQAYLPNALPYYVYVKSQTVGDSVVYECNESVENLISIYISGRLLVLKSEYWNSTTSTDEINLLLTSYLSALTVTPDYKYFIFSNGATSLTLEAQEDGTFTASDKSPIG